MKDKYKHLFFDLDHTLWDFEKNSEATLLELFDNHQLSRYVNDFESFHSVYIKVNEEKWAAYRLGHLDKATLRATRFLDTLRVFECDDPELAKLLDVQYLSLSPFKTNLMPNAIETLEALQGKYEMHIVTNGFIEVQRTKIENSGLGSYFSKRISSEEVGVNKPDPKIFTFAMQIANANPSNSLMIGDNHEADIIGAKKVGMDQVFYAPKGRPDKELATYTVQDLRELIALL